MAARAIVRKIIGNPQAFSILGVLRSPGIDRRTATPSSRIVRTTTTKDTGYVELWNNKLELEQQRLLPWLASSEIARTASKDKGDAELWNNKLHVLRPQVAKGWTSSLLSVQHHHGSGGGEGFLKFRTSSSQSSPKRELISVRRLGLQRPGPFDLARQVVEGVVCITTKDAFLLYNPTTGVTSPWIETTIAWEGEAKRKVVSIALGYDPRSGKHKVICISGCATSPESTKVGALVVEVLNVRNRTWTTGRHKWRKLEVLEGRCTFPDAPVYLDGKIHWQCYTEYPYVLEFDVKRETFAYTPFPKPLDELMDSSRQIRSMLKRKLMVLQLMVVDGKLAILKSTPGQKTSTLFVLYVKGGKIGWEGIEWTEETVLIR